MQLVVHAPFGSRINRAWGLALRKKFCVGFGFELQAAANEEAIVLSPRAAAQLPARRGVRLPAPEHRPRRAGPGAARRADVRDPLALERAARRCCSSAAATASGCPRTCCACAPTTCWPPPSPPSLACPETLPGGPIEVPDGPPDRAPDGRGLPHRGHGRGRVPRGPARACATAASSGAPSTPPSRRPSRAASSPASPTPSSTTRRSRSAAPRP